MQVVKETVESLKAQLQEVYVEWRGTQEMLALVLKTVGEKIHVTSESIKEGLPENTGIAIVEDQEVGGFWFFLEQREDEDE